MPPPEAGRPEGAGASSPVPHAVPFDVPTTVPTTVSTTGPLVGLQALRFAAALLVVAAHATFYVTERLDPRFGTWRAGTGGVEVFFAISGFVVLASGAGYSGRWRAFARRRIVRIVPLYWLATGIKAGVSLAAAGLVLHAQFEPGAALMSLLFLPFRNAAGRIEPLLGVGWTLTFEVAFYTLVALALAVRRDPLRVVGPVLAGAALAGALRPPGGPAILVYLDPIVLNFLSGMMVARWRGRGGALSPGIATAALAAGLALLLARPDLGVPLPFVLWPAATLIVLGTVALEPALRTLGAPMRGRLAGLGDASYALYLVHPLVAPAVPTGFAALGAPAALGPAAAWLGAGCAILAALAAGLVAHRRVEPALTRLANDLLERLGDHLDGRPLDGSLDRPLGRALDRTLDRAATVARPVP